MTARSLGKSPARSPRLPRHRLRLTACQPPPALESPRAPSREAVLGAATSTSLALASLGAAARGLASAGHAAGLPVSDAASLLPVLPQLSSPELPSHALAALALAGGVTAARLLLRRTWPAFRASGDAAGASTLRSLSAPDVLYVSLLSGAGEELLFRAALLPLVSPDWRGALVSAAVFGGLHVSGGRNASFALWAAGVGLAYGWLALSLHDGAAPAVAHVAANAAGGLLWRWEDAGERQRRAREGAGAETS